MADEKLEVWLLVKLKDFKKGLNSGLAMTKKFSKGVDKFFLKTAAGVGAVGAAAFGAAAGVAALINRVATAGDAIAKMARRTGLAVEYLSEMEYVLGLNDATIADLQTGFRGLSRFIDGVIRGTKEYTDINDQLGVSIYDNTGQLRTTQELMDAYMNAIRNLRDPVLQAGIAQRVFGRSAIALLPAINAARGGIAAARVEARKMGVTLSKQAAADSERFRDSLLRLKTTFWGLVKSFAEPFMNVFSDGMDRAAGEVNRLLPLVRELGKGAAVWLKVRGPQLLGWVKTFCEGVKSGITPAFRRLRAVAGPVLKALGVGLDELTDGAVSAEATLDDYYAAGEAGASSAAEAWEMARAKVKEAAGQAAATELGDWVGKLVGVLLELKAALIALTVALTALKVLSWVPAVIGAIAGAVGWLVGGVGKLVWVWGALVKVCGGALAVLVFLKGAGLGLVAVLYAIGGGLAGVVAWVGAAVAAVLASPAIVIAAIVGLLTFIGAKLYQYRELIGWMIARAWAGITGLFTGLHNAVAGIGPAILGGMQSAWQYVRQFAGLVGEIFVRAPGVLMNWVSGLAASAATWVWTGLTGIGRTIGRWIGALPGQLFGAVRGFVTWLGETIWSVLPGWLKKLVGLAGAAWEKVKDTLGFETKGSPSMKDVLQNTFSRMSGMVSQHGQRISSMMHGSMLGMAGRAGAGLPARMAAGRSGSGESSTTNHVSTNLNIAGILDDLFVRRQLSPQIQRAVQMHTLDTNRR